VGWDSVIATYYGLDGLGIVP